MNISFKRILLAVGAVLIAAAVIVTAFSIVNISSIRTVEGEIVNKFRMSNYSPYAVTVMFEHNGKTYTQVYSVEDDSYSIGDSYEVTYNALDPDMTVNRYAYFEHIYMIALPIAIVGSVIVFLTREGAKGFFTDFVFMHKKAAGATVILSLVLGIYAFWEELIFEPYGDFMAGLLEYLLLLFLLVAVPVAILVIWITVVIKDILKAKKHPVTIQNNTFG